MTSDRPTTDHLSNWLHETVRTPYSAEGSVGRVMRQLPSSPQRSTVRVSIRGGDTGIRRPGFGLAPALVITLTLAIVAAGVLTFLLLAASPRNGELALAPAATVSPASGEGVDVTLAGRFPRSLAGESVQVRSINGTEWVDQFDVSLPDQAAHADRIESLTAAVGATIGDLDFATAVLEAQGTIHTVGALKVAGVDGADLVDPEIEIMLDHMIEPMVEWIDIAGKHVARVTDASMPGADPSYLYPEEARLWIVTSEEPLLSEIFGQLP